MVGGTYSRPQLASIWGYKSYQAIARGVVTPAGSNKIILFVTEDKKDLPTKYVDRLSGDILEWEGPTDHFAENRMINVRASDDEIHLFYREKLKARFLYLGRLTLLEVQCHAVEPSKFRFRLLTRPSSAVRK